MASRPSWGVLGPALALVLAAALTVVVLATSADDDAGRAGTREPEASTTTALAVSSDAPRVTSLVDLLELSDLVVRGTVVASDRGRTFGEPGGAAVESRLVTIDVADVLAGSGPDGGTLLLEEEGWLADGTPIVVDGLEPLPQGTSAIWFLQAVPGGEAPTFIVVSAQGRYVVDGPDLRGVPGDALVAELAALGTEGLATAVRAGGNAVAGQ